MAASEGAVVSWVWLRLAGTESSTKHTLAASAPQVLPLQFMLVWQLQDEHHVSGSFAPDCFAEVERWIMSGCTAHHDVQVNMHSPGLNPAAGRDNSNTDMMVHKG